MRAPRCGSLMLGETLAGIHISGPNHYGIVIPKKGRKESINLDAL